MCVKLSTKDPRADTVAGVWFHTENSLNNKQIGATLKQAGRLSLHVQRQPETKGIKTLHWPWSRVGLSVQVTTKVNRGSGEFSQIITICVSCQKVQAFSLAVGGAEFLHVWVQRSAAYVDGWQACLLLLISSWNAPPYQACGSAVCFSMQILGKEVDFTSSGSFDVGPGCRPLFGWSCCSFLHSPPQRLCLYSHKCSVGYLIWECWSKKDLWTSGKMFYQTSDRSMTLIVFHLFILSI